MRKGVLKQVILVDKNMKKYILTPGEGMLTVPGFGVVESEKITGMKPGSIIESAGERLLYLEASLYDKISNLKRGAQVILPKDGTQIIFYCNIKSGDRVLEIGTGSGSLTLMLAQSVFPKGKVTSYEMNKKSAKIARHNIKKSGHSDVVEIIENDATNCLDEDIYDAAISDVPEPWEILSVVERALKPGGHFCAYVPTINQVERIVKQLRNRPFLDVFTLETLQRKIIVGERGTRPDFHMLGHTGYLCFGRFCGNEWADMK